MSTKPPTVKPQWRRLFERSRAEDHARSFDRALALIANAIAQLYCAPDKEDVVHIKALLVTAFKLLTASRAR